MSGTIIGENHMAQYQEGLYMWWSECRYVFTIAFVLVVLLFMGVFNNPPVLAGDDTWGDHILSGRLSWQKDGATVILKNKGLCDLTVRYWLDEAINTRTDRNWPFNLVLKPGEERAVLKLQQADTSKDWRFRGNYSWRQGSLNAVHDDNTVYRLPYPVGGKYRVIQGYNGPLSHKGEYKYSIDWYMPDNSEVCACREGLVVDVVDRFEGYGMTEEFRYKNNAIRILHPDGTMGEYVHFRKGGAMVKIGDRVKAGDPIGRSGNVGYSDCYHLHFNVYIPLDGSSIRTIPTIFDTKETGKTRLETGEEYTAK